MVITNEQIEAEIRELTAEADRMVSEVHEIFAESARLRIQIDHLKKLLELRIQSAQRVELISYILIGFAQKDEPSALCAITWSGSTSLPTDIRILVKREWQRLLPPESARYFADLLNDWKQRVQTEPGVVLAMIGELSVGPIRTMEQGTIHKDGVAQLMNKRLGDNVRYATAILWK